ncbi:hypothetical protein [Vreelandella venusta]|uniref:hypothetical protein n=1 Tax=Vreelandella venusta TaxID=44935 RepID=UPI001169D323|nr:hypothetical protein [Halomonas venusta]GEK52325.1 hypothetical protein HVE01_30460 [Halomonas venusta]
MQVGLLAVKGLAKLLTTAVAKRVAYNLLVVLGDWAVKQTTTDLDDKAFKAFKDGVDKRNGVAVNLYSQVR